MSQRVEYERPNVAAFERLSMLLLEAGTFEMLATSRRAIYRRGGRDHRVGRGPGHDLDHGSPDRGRGPSGDRAQHGRDLLPSNPYSTARHRGAVRPSELHRRAVESNILHATCNAFPRDTNNPPPTRSQELASLAQPEPLGLAVAGQS